MLSQQSRARVAVHANWDNYYRERWIRYASGVYRLDWNWAPAILGCFWFLHRKLPLAAFLAFFGAGFIYVAAKLNFGYAGFYIAFASVRALEGIIANRVMFSSIGRTLRKLEASGADDGQALKTLERRHQTLSDIRLP